MIPLSAHQDTHMKIEYDLEEMGATSFTTFTEALRYLMEEILTDDSFVVEALEPEDYFRQSDAERLTIELERSKKLEECLFMLAVACNWGDRSKKH